MLHDTSLVNEQGQRDWFESLSTSRTSQRLVVVDDETEDLMGVVRIDRIDHVNASLMLGLDVFRAYRGLRLSYWVYEQLFDYLFNHRNINRIHLEVLSTNAVALDLYRKLCFVTEGRAREALYRNGGYVDVLSMSLLRSEYQRDIEKHRYLATRFEHD